MFVESFGNDGFVDGADDLLFDLAVLDDEESWNASNIETRGCRAVGVNIQFAHFDAAFVFLSDCVNRRSQSTAWRTPGGPEVDQYRRV